MDRVLSEMRKRVPDDRVRRWARSRRASDLHLSVITLVELGVCRVERRDARQGGALRRWLETGVVEQSTGRVLSVDEAVARCAASLHVPDPRPDCDCLIAATALVHGMAVVTRNTQDFAPLGVRLLDPWSTP